MTEFSLPQPYAMLRPVRGGNAFEETIEHILQTIKLGIFAPADKLPPERELADRLGVSRATLREALGELQAAGYLEVKRGRYGGTYISETRVPEQPLGVLRLDPDDVHDVLVFRGVIEPAASALAAGSNLSAAARGHLRSCLADVSGASEVNYRPRDARFHIAIAELTGSPSLVAAVAETRARLNNLLDRIPFLVTNLEHSNVQHAEMADAILSGDPEAAERATIEHLEGTAALLRGFLS
ncbi:MULTISPECIES: FadR/GntR family transcriptional regulator [Arthrobacter]|nr:MULTISPECIES: FCD domain-containing protein [Arthrobacter]